MSHFQEYILAIDQSTSATKIILFDQKGILKHRFSIPHQQYYPQTGFVEHNPVEIFENTLSGIKQLLAESSIEISSIASIAITNQRETSLVWDRNTGLPIYNAAVWQCLRGTDFCTKLRNDGYSETIRNKTGLIVDPYFSASKLRWIIKNVPEAEIKAKSGDLLLGTMDSWLLWKLTGGKVHATDYSNACRTMLFNINTLEWDNELIELFGLHKCMFPKVQSSDEIFGYTSSDLLGGASIPIAGLIGDSHAALFGQNCFEPGMAKATYGTGSSIMMNIGKSPAKAPEGLVTSIGFGRNNQINYVFEGNIHCTGDTINWLKNELQLIDSANETGELANSVTDNNGVYMVPAFVGLGAPYWDNSAKASITGMGRDTNKAHIVRAALESIAYQVKDLIDLMVKEGIIELKELRVDGGPTRNNFLMQFQSDMLEREVVRSTIEEVSALGATYMAGLATGFWKDIEEIKTLYHSDRTFAPQMSHEEIIQLYSGWKKAVERTRLE
jgi:glycerol kinase